ncbi:zinc ribbon domain-containing protein [Nonomuraea glycinis]|uniref:zinc ribbon domain-containing protein n=1 Tax=Nonomuraea glycinis TaxID=2047744 RepID=UPI002E14CA4A|nr:transposase [Nonomuraea glycinis]
MPTEMVVARVGWLTGLTQALAAAVIAERWTEKALDELAGGVGPDGRNLPVKGYKALRRLGWGSMGEPGVYVSDRVRCCADEEAARALRLALHRRTIIEAILRTWPENSRKRTDAEWAALREALPADVPVAEIRHRTRQVQAISDAGGPFPAGITEAEDAPFNAAQIVLAAADKQLITVARTWERTVELRVQLPLLERPASTRDWAWHVLPVNLPRNVPGDALKICVPTLRVNNNQVRVDLPFEIEIPFAPASGHIIAAGFDWGLNTLLSATIGRLTPQGRVESDGRPLSYDASVVSAKLHRLRGHREDLAAKRRHYDKLLTGLADDDVRKPELLASRDRTDVEHRRVCARIRHLNDALAWNAARWAVDQASAVGATVIYLEDLATLEARGHRRGNARLSGQVRGRVVDAIGHLAAKAKIAVVTVPARGTSKFCPRCGDGKSALMHVLAPDRLTRRGWKWAYCPACGLSCDRDRAAAERIVSRGLLGQKATFTDRKTGKRAIRAIVDGNVTRVRRAKKATRAIRRARRSGTDLHPRPESRTSRAKTGPTRKRQTRVKKMTASQMPDRRPVPAPILTVGNRPAGQAPQTNRRKPGRTGLVRDFHHRTGFHKVKASPVLLLAEYGTGSRHATPPGTLNPHGLG